MTAKHWDVGTGVTANKGLIEVLLTDAGGMTLNIPMDVESATDLRNMLTDDLEFIQRWEENK